MRTVRLLFIVALWLPLFAAALDLKDISEKDAAALRASLPALFQSDPGLAVYDEAIRMLMKSGGYENVFVTRTGARYEIVGKPLRTVEDIVIKGNEEFDTSTLRELVEIKSGERFDRKKAVVAAERIKAHYGENGFFNAVVELEFAKLESKNIRLEYVVQEKPPCRITELVFDTPNTDLRAKLNGRFRSQVGRVLTTEGARTLMTDINEFLIEGRYLATEVAGPEAKYNAARTTAALRIEIREPYRWEVYFSGQKFQTQSDLYRALDLRNHERKNVDPAGEGAERIRRAYLADGFPNIRIDTKIVNPKATYLKRVYFHINEGARVRIRAVEVQGRITRPASYYQSFVLQNSSDLVRAGFYNRQDLENGFKNLVTELRNLGHLRARTLSSRVEYNDKKTEATVFLLLEEGPQTQIRAVDFEGNRFFSSFELAKVTELETNSALNLGEFEASIEKLRAFYNNQGFLEMKLLNEGDNLIEYNDRGTQARIVFRLFEGPRIRVSRVVIEGNSFTKSSVILKEADFKLNDLLTPDKIDDALVRLNKLNLFTRVDIRTLEENSNVAERTLVITVTERDPGIFRFGAGANNERNLSVRGFTGISYNNLWGTARAVSGRVESRYNVTEVRYPEYEVTAGYLEPFIFNTRTRGRLNLTTNERVAEYEETNRMTRLIQTNRVDLLAERDVNRNMKVTWKVWSLESNSEFEREGRCLLDELDKWTPATGYCKATQLQVATLGPTLDFDYRDSAFLPTRGSFTRLILDYSTPSIGSSAGVHFYKVESNFTHYRRMGTPRHVWANSLRGGHLQNLSTDPDSGVPASHAFLLGGIYTVRGFDISRDSERIPKDQSDFKVERETQKLVHEHSQYVLIKSELRFPLYGDHGGVVFYDGGAVFIKGYDFKRPYRDAIGFGYRYNTPVGPLALDFAFKISPEPKEDAFRFHLSIGTF